jgi:hypothetical protein
MATKSYSWVSPKPTMKPDLVMIPGSSSFIFANRPKERPEIGYLFSEPVREFFSFSWEEGLL